MPGIRMQDIEYFYSAYSAFAYLGSSRFMQIAASGHHRKDMTMANCLLIAADSQHHNIDQLAHALRQPFSGQAKITQ